MRRARHIEGGNAVPATVADPPVMDSAVASPALRLVAPDDNATAAPQPMGVPIADANDPRWILAVRTGELLQGTLLTPENRRRLSQLGRLLDLTPFDTNLIIAIVQDQARRGHAPIACAAAGERQLAFVAGPQPRAGRGRRVAITAGLLGVLFAVEALLLYWVF